MTPTHEALRMAREALDEAIAATEYHPDHPACRRWDAALAALDAALREDALLRAGAAGMVTDLEVRPDPDPDRDARGYKLFVPQQEAQEPSGETMQQREEVCAAWADLPDEVRKDPRLNRLYQALGGPHMEDLAASPVSPSCLSTEGEKPRLTPHQLWRERAIWLLDALTDATRELRDDGELSAMLAHLDKHPSLAAAPAAVAAEADARTWLPIDTAPKHQEVLAWREDAGALLCIYTYCADQGWLSDKEQDEMDEETLFKEDWWWFGPHGVCRMEGSEVPTHWMPLPSPPVAAMTAAGEQKGGEVRNG